MTGIKFLDLVVEGEIISPDTLPTQRPFSDLVPLFQALLDDPAIRAFGWVQYTPYFNDGEPCVFGAGTFWVATDRDPNPEDVDPWDLRVSDYHPSLPPRVRLHGRRVDNDAYDPVRWQACTAASEAVSSQEYDRALLEMFGDHARITVTRDGITITEHEP